MTSPALGWRPRGIAAAALLRGLPMLFVVLPVANLTLKPLAAEECAHGYRLKNLVRQLAISFAASTVIALQQHRLALHEVRLSRPGPVRRSRSARCRRPGRCCAHAGC